MFVIVLWALACVRISTYVTKGIIPNPSLRQGPRPDPFVPFDHEPRYKPLSTHVEGVCLHFRVCIVCVLHLGSL